MIGAIVVCGLAGALSSLVATLGNVVMARVVSGLAGELEAELPEPVFVRIACYRVIAKAFYLQALVFWGLFGVLTIIRLSITTRIF
jgi:hypothetical protein